MREERDEETRGPTGSTMSRRQILAGAAVAALAASARPILAQPKQRSIKGDRPSPTKSPLRRYMAASALLPDGRIVVTGGYDRPWANGVVPPALNTVAIYDPQSQTWSSAAQMSAPRARHAAVTLGDGRVAVLGGMGQVPTASVEIYDPRTNTWQAARALAQPRFDHNAVTDGVTITLLGGSAASMLGSIEVYELVRNGEEY